MADKEGSAEELDELRLAWEEEERLRAAYDRLMSGWDVHQQAGLLAERAGRTARARENYERAAEDARGALRLFPDVGSRTPGETFARLVESYSKLGLACPSPTEINVPPDEAARGYRRLRMFVEAEKILRDALDQPDATAWLAEDLASILLDRGQPDGAVEALQDPRFRDRVDPEALGDALVAAGRFADAADAFRATLARIEARPGDMRHEVVRVAARLGNVLIVIGSFRDASRAYRKARAARASLDLFSSRPACWGSVLVVEGRRDQAMLDELRGGGVVVAGLPFSATTVERFKRRHIGLTGLARVVVAACDGCLCHTPLAWRVRWLFGSLRSDAGYALTRLRFLASRFADVVEFADQTIESDWDKMVPSRRLDVFWMAMAHPALASFTAEDDRWTLRWREFGRREPVLANDVRAHFVQTSLL